MKRLTTLLLLASIATATADWPQFLGPERNGIIAENISAEFTGDEPEIEWSYDVGSGFAGPAVAGGVVYIFHRQGDTAVLEALTTEAGRPKWKFSYPTDYRDDFGFDNGPRAVPLVANGKVYLFGAEGMAHCLNAKTGEAIWAKGLRKEFAADKGFFGRAPSPLLAGGTLVLQIGGEGAGILGLDPETGAVRWKATEHEAGYASPIVAEVEGKRCVLAFTREGFLCLDPTDGKIWIEEPHRSAMDASVNAASPVSLHGGRLFLSACYGVGAVVLELDPAARTSKTVWQHGDRLDCHYATPVLFKNHLIGFHGRQETGTELRCIDAASGKVAWNTGRLPAGSVTLAGGTLIVLTERGELILAEADVARFEASARGQILANGTRAYPAISEGRLFARDKRHLVCVKLKAS